MSGIKMAWRIKMTTTWWCRWLCSRSWRSWSSAVAVGYHSSARQSRMMSTNKRRLRRESVNNKCAWPSKWCISMVDKESRLVCQSTRKMLQLSSNNNGSNNNRWSTLLRANQIRTKKDSCLNLTKLELTPIIWQACKPNRSTSNNSRCSNRSNSNNNIRMIRQTRCEKSLEFLIKIYFN